MNANKNSFGRTAGILLVVAVLLIAGLGVTNAAAKAAIPGDALYPLKSTLEQTRLALARDAGDRAEMKIAFADQRLAELDALIKEGRFAEVSRGVLSFESDINSAILELETVSKSDPARAAHIAQAITEALTRYAQSLSVMAAGAPESVRSDVLRALDTTRIAGSLDLSVSAEPGDDNSNANGNASMNDNSADGNENSSMNDNSAQDNSNGGLDDNSNTSGNTNTDDHGGNTNTGSNDNTNTGTNTNSNTNGDDSGGGGGGGGGGNTNGGGGGGGGGGGNSNGGGDG